jgi:Raf kinase inhibitor-like YbhB/YbcL family protein
MKASVIAAALLGTCLALPAVAQTQAPAAKPAGFRVTSPSFKGTLPMQHVFKGFGCDGGNVSPAVSWTGAPAGTKSFAVTVYDPDAPTGSGWWHWTVFNIPAGVTKLEAGAGNPEGKGLPAGAQQGRTDFGMAAFGGACPPPGDKPHRYILTVFALKADKIPLDASASGALVGFYLNANALAKTHITAKYGR